MSVTIDIAITELRSHALADPSTHLKPKGRDEVEAAIDRWKARGLTAHVLVVDPTDSLRELLGAWDKLGFDAKRDLLLVFDTKEIAARGWGLSDAQLVRALEASRPHDHEVFSKRLVDALDALGAAASPHETAHDDTGSSFPMLPVIGGITGIVTASLVSLAIVRRNKLAREGLAKLSEAKSSADRAYSDLVLACEDLPGDPKATEIQLKASELKKRVDAIVTDTEAKPARGNDPVTIGKIRQLENEMAALRSTVLQKEKR